MLRVADPRRQVAADPRAGGRAGQGGGRPPVGRRQVLADGDRVQLRAAAQTFVQRIEEDVAVVLVVLPAVLAVQDDADQVGPVGIVDPPADLQQPVNHVLGGLAARQPLVQEADAVRQFVVAEDDVGPSSVPARTR